MRLALLFLVNDMLRISSGEVLVARLEQLTGATDPDEVRRLAKQVEGLVFHTQFRKADTRIKPRS